MLILSSIVTAVKYTAHEMHSFIHSYLYDAVVSNQVTIYTYEQLVQRISQIFPTPKRILDVGVGTGVPLAQIAHKLPQGCDVLGIDIDADYLQKAKRIFKGSKQIKVSQRNFYNMDPETDGKFDAILFTSSFILLEQKEEALQRAKSLLNPNGRIYFIVTLNDNSLVDKVAYNIKYLTSIDLKLTRDQDFENCINEAGLKTINKTRLTKFANLATHILRVFMYETQLE